MQRERVFDFRARDLSRLGICNANIPSVCSVLNEATENLLYDALSPEDGYWGTWLRLVFNLTQATPYIVAPWDVARLILMDVCQRPVRIQNGFYEFLDFGRGLQPRTGCGSSSGTPTACNQFLQGYDREAVYTLGTLVGPATLRFFVSDPVDVGKTVIVGGTDQNGQNILSTDPQTQAPIQGEVIRLASPFVDSVNQFLAISGIQKDGTNGPVTIMQVAPGTLAQTSLSVMQPSETTANYRRYLVNGLPAHCPCDPTGNIQVTAMCKADYKPVRCDADYLIIPNIPALLRECEAIRMMKSDSKNAMAMAQLKHTQALQLLFGQLQHHLGNERPAITLPIFGSNRLRPQPI